jgi:hypothetical protein
MTCTCSGGPTVTVDVENNAVGYVAVKVCEGCGSRLDQKILGSSSKYVEWTEDRLLEQFS